MKMMMTKIDRKGGRGVSRHSAGFTLIELMVVLAIVAILLMVGLPAYRDQIIRGNRAAAKSAMMDIANRQHQYMLANRSYFDKTYLTGTVDYELPDDLPDLYTFDISTVRPANAPFFVITFTAIGTQAEDGDLTLNSEGVGSPASKWER